VVEHLGEERGGERPLGAGVLVRGSCARSSGAQTRTWSAAVKPPSSRARRQADATRLPRALWPPMVSRPPSQPCSWPPVVAAQAMISYAWRAGTAKGRAGATS
jgi:hypothetical protein